MNNRRLLIGIILTIVLAFAVVYEYGYTYIKQQMSLLQEEKQMKIKTIMKYRKILSEAKDIATELQELKQILRQEESKLLPGETASVASANLQEKVKNWITANGGRIRSERMERTKQYGTYKEITVTFDLEFDGIEPLSNLLYTIESDRTMMTIKELNIRVKNYRKPGTLVVRLRISALAR